MSQADLLRLLEAAHPGRPQADLLAMIEATPDNPRARTTGKPVGGNSGRPSIFPIRKPQRPPERSKSIERRRRLAYSGPLPPQLAAQFTLGELSCLRIISDEMRERGFCALTLGAIAARAGCCRELAKRAVRKAGREELLTCEERRRPGQVNLPNVIRIISREWLAWITRGPRSKGIGETKSAPTGTRLKNKGFRNEEAAQAPGQTSKASPFQASPRPDSTAGRGISARSSMDGGSTKGKLPGVQWWGMHRDARLRGA